MQKSYLNTHMKYQKNTITMTTSNSNHNQDLHQTHTHTQSTEITEEARVDRESASTLAVVGFK